MPDSTNQALLLIAITVCLVLVLQPNIMSSFTKKTDAPRRILSDAEIKLFTTTSNTGEIVMVGANGVLIDQGSQAVRVGTDKVSMIASNKERVKVSSSGLEVLPSVNLGTSGAVDASMELMTKYHRLGTSTVQNACSFGIAVGAKEANIASDGRVDFRLNTGAGAGNTWGSIPTTTVMTLLGGGNVGIGTTNPQSILHVNHSTSGFARLSATDAISSISEITFDNALSGYWHQNGYSNNPTTSTRGAAYAAGMIRCNNESGSNYEDSFMTFWTCRDAHSDGVGGLGVLNERMRITSTGNVGIGTTNPTNTLHVYTGNASPLILEQSSTSANYITFKSNNTVYGYFGLETSGGVGLFGDNTGYGMSFGTPTATNVNIATNNIIRATVHSNGNVGIGLTNPSEKLTTNGNGLFYGTLRTYGNGGGGPSMIYSQNDTDGDGYALMHLRNNTGGGCYWFLNSSGRSADGGVNTTTLRNDVGDLRLHSRGANGIMIKTDTGNVGVGTENPYVRLDVRGAGNGSSTANWISSCIGVADNSKPKIVMGVYSDTAIIGAHSGALDAWDRLCLNPAGNVGIGTLNPTTKLQVNGSTWISNPNASLRIGATNFAGTTSAVYGSTSSTNNILFSSWRDVNTEMLGAKICAINRNGAYAGAVQYTDLAFYTHDDITHVANFDDTVERMRIAGNGFVGIGTDSPQCPLHVNGYRGFTYTGGNYGYFTQAGGINYGANGYFNTSIYASNSIITRDAIVSVNVQLNSDIRIKENIQPKKDILSIIDQINIYSYDHIDKTHAKVEVGVIAQEIQDILPNCVNSIKGFLPNIYKLADSHEAVDGKVFIMVKNTAKVGDKVRLHVQTNNQEIEHAIIVHDCSPVHLLVDSWANYSSDEKMFVYGTEDPAILNVDKVQLGLTALGGVKELSEIVKRQQQTISTQARTIDDLNSRLYRVETILSQLIR